MEDIIKISCPVCSGVLKVRRTENMESKHVTCPICNKRSLFTAFRIVIERPEESTQIGNVNEHNHTVGQLYVPNLNRTFPLNIGRNLIGRKSNASSADIQIPCETKRMSREHIIIDVKDVNGQINHYLSLNKAQVNDTFINNVKLEFGDKIILKNYDIINLPDIDVRFNLADEDETDIN